MRQVKLKTGELVPALGLGTWHMGENSRKKSAEVAALRLGLDLGLTLIDTAEMYGEGGAEEVVAEAIAGRRDGVYVISKVYPHNASRDGTIAACERSLRRLKTDRLDLYLLHWRGRYPLEETVAAFETLRRDGKIRGWGVSNFDVDDMQQLVDVVDGGNCVSNQVLYHLGERGIEHQLLGDMAQAGVMTMAYSPLGQGPLLDDLTLAAVARKHAVTPAAVALAFLLEKLSLVAIPKASTLAHVQANAAATEITLDAEDRSALDRAFPPPNRAQPLAML